MIRWLYRYISTPSRYSGDPRGYLLNQIGYAPVAVDWRIAAIQLLWLVAGSLSRSSEK